MLYQHLKTESKSKIAFIFLHHDWTWDKLQCICIWNNHISIWNRFISIYPLPTQWLHKLLTPSDHLLNAHTEGKVLNAQPMKNIYMYTQGSHNCSDLFLFQAVVRILQLQVRLDGQVISRCETACVIPTNTDWNVPISIFIKNTSVYVFFTSKHLHSGLVHAGSQRALLYSPLLCGILSWRELHTAPGVPLHAHSVQTPHILPLLFPEGPVRQEANADYFWKWWNFTSMDAKCL